MSHRSSRMPSILTTVINHFDKASCVVAAWLAGSPGRGAADALETLTRLAAQAGRAHHVHKATAALSTVLAP